MYILAKVGTMPMGRYKVLRKRNAPKVGDSLMLRGIDAWQDERVNVTEIKNLSDGITLYYVEKM